MTIGLSVIIVNWNGGALVRRAVESVIQSPPRMPFEIVVVDNASADDSVPWLNAQATAGRCRLIQNETNLGFSRANNRAIADTRAPLMCLLNLDAEVTPGAIDTLIDTVRSHPRNGACGPRLIHPDGSLQPSAWPNPPAAWQTVLAGTGLWRAVPPALRGRLLLGGHWDHSTRRSVPMLFGAALLVRREVIDDVGPLDGRFHMYAEDNEWCLRMTRAGWRVIFEPGATVVHHGGYSTTRRWSPTERIRVRLQSDVEFQRSCLPPARFVRNLFANCTVTALQCAAGTIRSAPADEAAVAFQVYASALKQAMTPRRVRQVE